jgi:hypothetical protein
MFNMKDVDPKTVLKRGLICEIGSEEPSGWLPVH